MALTAKQKQKYQKRLTMLRLRMRRVFGCWVCLSQSGLKTARSAVAVRCKQCFDAGRHTPATLEFEKLRDELQQEKEDS